VESALDAGNSPEKADQDEDICVIASQSIDSFKLRPEFVGTANKPQKGLSEFNSNLP
jgi:hypothetical protein